MQFDQGDLLAEKLALANSVVVRSRSDITDRVSIRVKEHVNLKYKVFIKFRNAAYSMHKNR